MSLTHGMQFNFIYAEFRINFKTGRSYHVYSKNVKKMLKNTIEINRKVHISFQFIIFSLKLDSRQT